MQYTTNYSLKKPQYADEADIEVINDNTDDVDTLIHQNRTMIAPAFDNTKAYVTGDPVEYLGALYVFTADKAAGAWDASKVEPTTAAEMGGGGASALADLDDVEITSPTEGQALLYDDSDDKWKNGTLPDPSVTKTATGNPIEIADAASAPIVKCVTEIQGYQEGSGTPSPDNIRPITAYTEGEIEVSDGDGNTTTHTTTYPSAIYRGSEDCVEGEVTEEWKKVVFDGSNDEQWYFSINAGARSQNVAYITISDIAKRQTPIANLFEGLSNRSYNDLNPWQCASPSASGNETYVNFVVDKTLITSLSDWRTWLSNNNLEFAYQLEKATTSSVTPTNLPIKSLSGYNHIESSTGEMEIEYITKTYEPLVELIQSSDHIYSTQEQIVGTWVDGKTLYEKTIVKQNISSASSSTVLIPSSELTGMDIVEIGGSYVSRTTASTYPINAYINSNTIIATWLAEGNIYYWLYWGAADTYDAYITIRYTKSSSNRSLSAPVTSQKSISEPLTDKTEEVPTEEEKTVEKPETEEETNETER